MEAYEIAVINGKFSKARRANAQAVLLNSRGCNSIILRSADADIACSRGWSGTCSVANAHTVFAMSCGLASSSRRIAADDIA